MAGTRQVWRDAGRAIRWCAGRVQYRADYTGVRADTGGSMGMGVASREHSEARYRRRGTAWYSLCPWLLYDVARDV